MNSRYACRYCATSSLNVFHKRMGSLTPLKLPAVDFSMEYLKPGTSSWYLVRNQVHKALEEFGCFEAVYDKVLPQLQNALFVASEDLFDLPTETKMLNTSEKPYYGYVGQETTFPLYEGLGIDEPINLEQVESFTNLMWPTGNPTFCETMHSFGNQMAELEQMVKRMIFESYGVEKYYQSFSEEVNYLLRVMKYTAPRTNEITLGVDSHTDKSCITILYQNHVEGLEIQSKDGEWIKHTPSANSFVVMLGEAMMAWSNGRLHSPHHRVMLIGNEPRYCAGFFSFGKGIIQTPEELVDAEHPLLFKPFDAMGLLNFFYTEEGQKPKYTVKAYCGV